MTDTLAAQNLTQLRRVLRHSAAVCVGIVAAFVLLELAYRIVRAPGLGPTTNPTYVEYDPLLGWRYRPGVERRHRAADFDVTVSINSRGFRGPDWGSEADSRLRVLVLGDSLAFGWGVEFEQCFTALLEQRLPECRFLNAAVAGYGTDQELLQLKELNPELAPAVVVAVFCENDLYETASNIAYGRHKPCFIGRNGRLELEGVPVPYPWYERSSYLARALGKRRWEWAMSSRRPDPDREWLLVCDLYRAMRDVLEGTPLLLVSDQQRLSDLAAEEPAIDHVDLRPVFSGSDAPITFVHDKHWTARTHERIADALEARVRELLSRRK